MIRLPEAQETLRMAALGELEFEHPEQLRSAVCAAQEIVSRCEGTVKQVYEHNVNQQELVIRVAGAPHAPQEEYQDQVEEAEYELLEDEGDRDPVDESADDELEVRVAGRPPARREE